MAGGGGGGERRRLDGQGEVAAAGERGGEGGEPDASRPPPPRSQTASSSSGWPTANNRTTSSSSLAQEWRYAMRAYAHMQVAQVRLSIDPAEPVAVAGSIALNYPARAASCGTCECRKRWKRCWLGGVEFGSFSDRLICDH
eukprot:jgi/Chlat1/1163/Chrsp112S01629